MLDKPIVVELDDPTRCNHISPGLDQCRYKSTPGYNFCIFHGGGAQKSTVNNYRLTKWQQRLNEKANNEQVKSLREEIGLLRILLEERLNRCETSLDLILESGPISDLILKINAVVSSCHRLESSMGILLDRQSIIQFANEVINILAEVLGDDSRVELIANRLVERVENNG